MEKQRKEKKSREDEKEKKRIEERLDELKKTQADEDIRKRQEARLKVVRRELQFEEVPIESKISRTLSERMTKTVIVLILTTLFILPLFDYGTYISATASFDIGLEMLVVSKDDTGTASSEFTSAYSEYVDWHSSLDIPLVYLEIDGYSVIWEDSPGRYKELRS